MIGEWNGYTISAEDNNDYGYEFKTKDGIRGWSTVELKLENGVWSAYHRDYNIELVEGRRYEILKTK